MIWLSFAFTLLQFVVKLPDLIAWLQTIFAKWATIPESKHRGEAKRLTAAMREALVQHHLPSLTAKTDPLAVYAAALERRYPTAAEPAAAPAPAPDAPPA